MGKGVFISGDDLLADFNWRCTGPGSSGEEVVAGTCLYTVNNPVLKVVEPLKLKCIAIKNIRA